MIGFSSDEPERFANEAQHSVTLVWGFWLVDTACSPALWQSMMGNNPAYFWGDPQNPVERVS